MPKDEFMRIKHRPDPMLGEKDCEAFEEKTSECDQPSFANVSKKPKSLPFSASVKHIHWSHAAL